MKVGVAVRSFEGRLCSPLVPKVPRDDGTGCGSFEREAWGNKAMCMPYIRGSETVLSLLPLTGSGLAQP